MKYYIILLLLIGGFANAQYIDGLDIRDFEDETITVRYNHHFLVPSLLLADGYTIPLKRKKTVAMRENRRVRLYNIDEIKYFITRYGYDLISEEAEMGEHARTGGGEFAVKIVEKDRTILIFKNKNN